MRKFASFLPYILVASLVAVLAVFPPLIDFGLGVAMYIVYGAVARLYLPYFRKIYEGKSISFKPEYFVSFLVSLVITIPTGMGLLSSFMGLVQNVESRVLVLVLAFIYGFGGDSLMKEVLGWIRTINQVKREKARKV